MRGRVGLDTYTYARILYVWTSDTFQNEASFLEVTDQNILTLTRYIVGGSAYRLSLHSGSTIDISIFPCWINP